MARKREPIFPLFEEVRRVTAALTDEQFGKAIRYALSKYYGNEECSEPDTLTMFAATMLLEQAARYDNFREKQRNNALTAKDDAKPSAANVSQMKPKQAQYTNITPNTPPIPVPSPIPNSICSKAVRLLNELSGSSFRDTSKNTQRHIAARINDGYGIEDIEMVIRHQCRLWGRDEKMRQYLRPETLFGNKFEGYLSDARRSEQKQEQGYVLAPLVDPFDAVMGGGGNV